MYVVKLKDKETGVYKIKYKRDITLSKFIPKGLGSVINTIPDDNYVLGVCYNNDNQICMSGKMKLKESPMRAMKREMQEEMYLSTSDLIYCKRIGNNYFYKVDIQDCNINYWEKINTENDVNKRVVCCIYGKFSDIIDYITNVRINEDNSDNIKGVWAVDKKTLLDIIYSKNI